jgi:hypothetical protein
VAGHYHQEDPPAQGYPATDHIWYRAHVRVPPQSGQLLFGVGRFRGSYEVFVNGTRIGGEGNVSGRGEVRFGGRLIGFGIPQEAVRSGELTIAIRGAVGKINVSDSFTGSGIMPGSRVVIGGRSASPSRSSPNTLPRSASTGSTLLSLLS